MPGAHGLGVMLFQKDTVPIPYNLVTGEFQKPPKFGLPDKEETCAYVYSRNLLDSIYLFRI